MARFRNISPDERFIPDAVPNVVGPDGLFEVPDEKADGFAAQPWFAPAPPAPPVSKKKG